MKKKHISLWIDENVLELCDASLKISGLKNRGEYIEEAIKLYSEYIENENSEGIVNKSLIKTMEGMIENFENRMARLMFKQAVETSKVFWLIVKGFHLEPEDVAEFHEDCVEEVKRINGAIDTRRRKKKDEF